MNLWDLQIPIPVALAAVATIGYLVGHRSRAAAADGREQARRELRRARAVARELEKIALTVRKNLAKHNASVSRFKQRVSQLNARQQADGWQNLCREAEEMLAPTLQLATQIASAYDQIRQQTNHLMSLTEARTDPLTGVGNRRGLDKILENMLAVKTRYETTFFSMIMFDIDHFKEVNDRQGHLRGDHILKQVAGVLDEHARETDVVTRYGGEEFVVVMPQTDLEGACVFGERMRQIIEQETSITVSGGVAVAVDGDTPESLLSRADAAMYSAKSAGRNCVFRHDGDQIESVVEPAPAETVC